MGQSHKLSEAARWHASWIIAALCAFAIAGIPAWTVLDMMPLIVIISIVLILGGALLWLLTPPMVHIAIKVLSSMVLMALATITICWAVKHDRPIFNPQMQGVAIKNTTGGDFGIDVEIEVRNSGRQSGYADEWKLKLIIDGSTVEGHRLYGQTIPSRSNESEISDQEFSVGRPVRGWVFFSFPTISHEYAASYFACGSPLIDKVSLSISVRDSKTKHEWSQFKGLRDLGNGACIPAVVVPVPPVGPGAIKIPSRPARTKSPEKEVPQTQQETAAAPSPLSTETIPKTQKCETGSICNQDSSVNAPQTVNNNFGPPEPHITVSAESTDTNGDYQCRVTIHTDVEMTSKIVFTLFFDRTVEDQDIATSDTQQLQLSINRLTGKISEYPNNVLNFSVMSPSSRSANGNIYVVVHSKQPIKLLAWERGNPHAA
jgi:hypothetical protein